MKPSQSGVAGWRGRGAAVSALALALAAAWPPPAIALAQSPASAEAASGPALTLEGALRRAVAADPARPGLDARLRGVEAGVRQAGLRPNPTLGLMVENLPTLGGGDILGRTETTLTYEQKLERGGDRSARTGLAQSEGLLITAQAQIAQLDRLELVQRAWVDAMAAEAQLDIARERLSLAEGFQREVQRRVNAARDPLFAGARAEAELAQAQIDFDQAEIAVRVARIVLAKFWDGVADFRMGSSDFDDTSAAWVAAGAVAQADLEAFRARQAIADAQVRLEQARAVPDPTVSIGVRHIWDNEAALVFGGSMPLQRYDRNQGAIDRARADGLAARADQNALRLEREREIARLQVQLLARANEARRIAEETQPQAERAVVLVREGFARGGFTYNDVMSAHAALLQAKARRAAVLQTFHNDRARLDRLTGAHADLLGLETQP
ncbi:MULTISPECIES: TolC family protein [Brevundimonas]|uniref:Cobalt-zinc-cadmium efflux system outer membrane protein n=1 Tax=Brevundimonas bullata TaxID=13160 RepID=A0A7W7N4H5_9CAUL|nr:MULTISPECIES: TolC family protein [Brevundimonas]MBB4799610.1 cobalt-zinc-cadmium efflux system outer membrane protein [Brevundimonas bullata]MBB6384319.1 cobalt-zinc-cadmium efflux system outer membrane protein [Brevundimonas bullata]